MKRAVFVVSLLICQPAWSQEDALPGVEDVAAMHGWDLEMEHTFKGGKEPPKLDYDPAKKIREYLTARVPKAAGKELIVGSISLEGCYAVPTGKTGGRTDPRAKTVRRPAGAEGGLRSEVTLPPDREWKPLNKAGIAVFAAYPAPGAERPIPDGSPFANAGRTTFIFLIGTDGKVFGVVRPMDFSARKPGTPDEQPDDGQLDPFAPK